MSKIFKGPLKSYFSKTLNLDYVVIEKEERGLLIKQYLTEKGVLFSSQEVNKTKEELIKIHQRRVRLGENVWDYNFALSTGALRMLRGRKNPVVKSVEKGVENVYKNNYPIYTEEETKTLLDTEVNKTKVIVGLDTKILSIVSLIISVGAVILSLLYTKDFLLGFNNGFTSYVLSSIMVMFASVALTIALLFKREGNKGISMLFCFLWIVVTLFSMTSTVAVNYNRFEFTQEEELEENREVNAIRLELESIALQKQSKLNQIAAKDNEIARYEELDMFSRGVFPSQEERNRLQEEYDTLLEEERALRSKEPEAVIIEDVKKRNFFNLLEDLTGVDSGTMQFLLSTLPAIFIDIIAPFGIATSVSLLTKRRKKDGSKRA